MLLAQPILIKKGKPQVHRALGKVSYVLMPLIVLGILLVGRDGYYASLEKGGTVEAVGGAYASLFF